jgi:hypothetical protein
LAKKGEKKIVQQDELLLRQALQELAKQAKSHFGFHEASNAKLETEKSEWGTNMDSVGQVFKVELYVYDDQRSLLNSGTMCLTRWPGTKKPPEVDGRFQDWSFHFRL